MRAISTIAASAALFSTASAWGTAYVKSFCGSPVSIFAVDADRNPQGPDKVLNFGDVYSEPIRVPSGGGGVSIKIGWNPSLYSRQGITQFEYTPNPSMNLLYYDGSNVDCQIPGDSLMNAALPVCPFAKHGAHMETSISSCPQATCQANQPCSGFYRFDKDDINTLACGQSADIWMYLCSENNSGPSAAEIALFPNLVKSVTGAVTGTVAPVAAAVAAAVVAPVAAPPSTLVTAVAASVTSKMPVVKVAAVDVPSDTASPKPVYQMEALAAKPGSAYKHKRSQMKRHEHMRRHAHHQS